MRSSPRATIVAGGVLIELVSVNLAGDAGGGNVGEHGDETEVGRMEGTGEREQRPWQHSFQKLSWDAMGPLVDRGPNHRPYSEHYCC